MLKALFSSDIWSRCRVLRQVLVSLIMICAVFPDVVSSESTFRMTDQQWATFDYATPTQFYPVPEHLNWYTSGLNDPGGAQFQSEPMMEFMRYNFATRNSPYWDPFSSAGSLGPETLVDLKFSAFTLAYAALGGGSHIYDMLTLFCWWVGVFFVLRLCEGPLRLHPLAGLAAAIFFMLNGFATANVASNVAQSYPFVPMCLYASFLLIEKRSVSALAAATAAFMVLMSFTFLPTTITMILAIVACSLGFAWSIAPRQNLGWRLSTRRACASLALAGLLAFLGLAFIYLPMLENLGVTKTFKDYSLRIFWPASWDALLSLFSPSHFFESYRSGDSTVQQVSGNTLFHYGIIGAGVSACCWRKGKDWLRPLVAVNIAVIAVVLGRVFGVPGISEMVGLLPILRNLGEQYILVSVSISLMILVALGAQNILKWPFAMRPVYALLAIIALAALLAGYAYGLHAPNLEFKKFSLELIVLLSAAMLFLTWFAQRAGPHRNVLLSALLVLMFAELITDAKSIRFAPHDIFRNPTSEVTFLKDNIGLARSMTFGQYATSMEAGSAYQIQEITSLNPGALPDYIDYFKQVIRYLPKNYRWGDFLSLAMPQQYPDMGFYYWDLVDLLGVRYIVLPNTSTLYIQGLVQRGDKIVHVSKFTTVIENTKAFPRAFLVDTPANPASELVIAPRLHASDVTPVDISSYRNASVTLQGTAARPGVVVLTDNWHRAWRATLNGKRVPILRVQGTFRGVIVPAGPFRIEMTYTPRTLPAAIALTTLVMLFLIGTLIYRTINAFRNGLNRIDRRNAPRTSK